MNKRQFTGKTWGESGESPPNRSPGVHGKATCRRSDKSARIFQRIGVILRWAAAAAVIAATAAPASARQCENVADERACLDAQVAAAKNVRAWFERDGVKGWGTREFDIEMEVAARQGRLFALIGGKCLGGFRSDGDFVALKNCLEHHEEVERRLGHDLTKAQSQ